MQLVDTVVSGATENFDKIKDIISKSMDVEIGEMQKQLEGIIRDMEQGKRKLSSRSRSSSPNMKNS